MDELYLSRRIHVAPHLNLDTDCWIPKADVFWDENGRQFRHTLTGPGDRFKIIDDAVNYAMDSARRWINEQVSRIPLRNQ
jgi:hypothetical protein